VKEAEEFPEQPQLLPTFPSALTILFNFTQLPQPHLNQGREV
jgi:hypothetical protein